MTVPPDTMNGPAKLFISYASKDVARAAALDERLRASGHTVWFDKARLNPGCKWHDEIKAGCDAARVILPIVTPGWRKSEWTRYETYASPAVIPLVAEGDPAAVLTPPLRRWQAKVFDPLTADDTAWRDLLTAIDEKLAEPTPERLPFLVRLPHDPNPHFTGREADMNRLHEALHEGPVAALTQARVRALTAMGGVGKTTLANEYVRRYWRLWPATRPGPCRSSNGRWTAASACSARTIRTRLPA
ncbi:MAG: toll/interleukin-1 receptor domain-containing protein [Acetobacteraceae bacterium]|nr:toll/interleukin-1 receptor domain-containing protein [Acetobacteraceae bacterium]